MLSGPRSLSLCPRRLSSATLCLAVFLTAARALGGTLTVNVVGVGGPAPEELRLVAKEIAAAGTVKLTELTSRLRGSGHLVLAPGVWRLVGSADGYWAMDEVVNVEKQSQQLTIRVWRAGVLSGQLGLPAGTTFPDSVGLRIQTPPGVKSRLALPATDLACPIIGNTWKCSVPAVALDVEIRVRGYIPHYKWDIRVQPNSPAIVGHIVLERGSSVAGRVRLPTGPAAGSSCKVSVLTRDGHPMATVGKANPFSSLVNQRGFYQFRHVPSGPYLIRAEQENWARASAPINVGENVETRVDPLLLERGETLEVVVTPTHSPGGKPWRMQLLNVEGALQWAKEEGIARADGTWSLPGISPGPYWLFVSDDRGNRWAHREIEVVPGADPVRLELDGSLVSGTVSLGTEPLEASVIFGGRRGAVRVPLQASPDGEFEGLIPERSEWDVFVEASNPQVRRTLIGVKPETSARGRKEFHLRLPDTKLRVTAKDERGQPVVALVNVQSLAQSEPLTQGFSSETGELELHGLTPGSAIVIAQARDRSSRQAKLELRESSTAYIDLVLHPNTKIGGRIIGPDGAGVPLARVMAHAAESPQFWPAPDVLADAEGNFELTHLPIGMQEVVLTVGARGFVLKKVRAVVVAGRIGDVTLEQWGGSVILELVHRDQNQKERMPYLLFGGSFSSLWDLRSWAAVNSEGMARQAPARSPGERESLQIPQLAPGFYALCLATFAERLDIAWGRLPASCSQGVLASGGVLSLEDPTLKDVSK